MGRLVNLIPGPCLQREFFLLQMFATGRKRPASTHYAEKPRFRTQIIFPFPKVDFNVLRYISKVLTHTLFADCANYVFTRFSKKKLPSNFTSKSEVMTTNEKLK